MRIQRFLVILGLPFIAMLAAQYYQIADGAANPVLDRQLQVRLKQLEQYLAQERTPDGAHYVEDRMDSW